MLQTLCLVAKIGKKEKQRLVGLSTGINFTIQATFCKNLIQQVTQLFVLAIYFCLWYRKQETKRITRRKHSLKLNCCFIKGFEFGRDIEYRGKPVQFDVYMYTVS
jgi:hypothetical protein